MHHIASYNQFLTKYKPEQNFQHRPFFSGKFVLGGTIFSEKIGPGPKFSAEQNFRDSTTMKMMDKSHLPNINPQFHVLPMQLYHTHAEPTFMKAQKCPIYLGIHTYDTLKSAFTVIPTPIAKLIHCCLLQLYTCYAMFAYCKIILYTGGCAIIRNFTSFLLMNSAAA